MNSAEGGFGPKLLPLTASVIGNSLEIHTRLEHGKATAEEIILVLQGMGVVARAA